MKRWSYVLTVGVILVGVSIGLHNQRIPVNYDKNHVDKLTGLKGYDASLVEVYKMNNPSIRLYNPGGVEWEGEAGDFRKIQIKFVNNRHLKIFELENLGGWEKVGKWLELPKGSQKVHKNPYFISMDMEGGAYVLVFIGYHYATGPAFLTLIYVSQDKAEVIFNKEVDLDEVAETCKGGYRLIGRLGGQQYEENPCEILIEDQKLSFRPLPFEQVYESQDLPVVLYDCIGWGHHKQEGDFMRIQARLANGELRNIDSYSHILTQVSPTVKLPAASTRIQKDPYYIVLDADKEEKVLVVCGHTDEENPLGIYHLAKLSPTQLTPMASMGSSLEEIVEMEQGYCLVERYAGGQVRQTIIENGQIVHWRRKAL